MKFFAITKLGRTLLSAAAAMVVVMLCWSCAAIMGTDIVEGVAKPRAVRWGGESSGGVCSENFTASGCRNYCNNLAPADKSKFLVDSKSELCPSHVWREGKPAATCDCVWEKNLSLLANVGSTSSEQECSVSAWNQGHRWSYYDSRNGRCYGEGIYEVLGETETKEDCKNLWIEKGKPGAYTYKPESKNCYALSY